LPALNLAKDGIRMYFSVEPAPRYRLPLYKTILCATCVLILIANGVSLFQNLQSLKGANFLIGQTARVADRLQYLNLLVMDAESSLRGYFLSGSDIYLGPSKTIVAEVEDEFNELKALLSDNPSQRKNLTQLQALVRRKIANMNQAVDVYKEGGLNEIVKIAQLSDERAALDEIGTKRDAGRAQCTILQRISKSLDTRRRHQRHRHYRADHVLPAGAQQFAQARGSRARTEDRQREFGIDGRNKDRTIVGAIASLDQRQRGRKSPAVARITR
jgi:CHASE3 domain sensor protein